MAEIPVAGNWGVNGKAADRGGITETFRVCRPKIFRFMRKGRAASRFWSKNSVSQYRQTS